MTGASHSFQSCFQTFQSVLEVTWIQSQSADTSTDSTILGKMQTCRNKLNEKICNLEIRAPIYELMKIRRTYRVLKNNHEINR